MPTKSSRRKFVILFHSSSWTSDRSSFYSEMHFNHFRLAFVILSRLFNFNWRVEKCLIELVLWQNNRLHLERAVTSPIDVQTNMNDLADDALDCTAQNRKLILFSTRTKLKRTKARSFTAFQFHKCTTKCCANGQDMRNQSKGISNGNSKRIFANYWLRPIHLNSKQQNMTNQRNFTIFRCLVACWWYDYRWYFGVAFTRNSFIETNWIGGDVVLWFISKTGLTYFTSSSFRFNSKTHYIIMIR